MQVDLSTLAPAVPTQSNPRSSRQLQSGPSAAGSLSCFLRSEQGEVVAGLSAFTWGDYCQIDDLWVQAGLRGQGLGSLLLEAVEREALLRGCTEILLDTHIVSYPDFYHKRGYQLSDGLQSCSCQGKHYRKTYLKKQLAALQ